MSSLHPKAPESRFDRYSKRRPDSLDIWAEELGKSKKTVVRYAKQRILPGAYQTKGGQWRAPYSQELLEQVKAKLEGFARIRGPSDPFAGTEEPHKEATRWKLTYALFCAIRRKRFDEKRLAKVYQHFFYSVLPSSKRRQRLARASQRCRDWKACVECVVKNGTRKAALVAAFAHAIVELDAESFDEALRKFGAEAFRPFGLEPRGTVVRSQRRQPKKRKKGKGTESKAASVMRAQVLERAKAPVPWTKVIQHLQRILGRRGIKNQPPQMIPGNLNHPRGHNAQTARYYSRRTFYNWYSKSARREAICEAAVLLAARHEPEEDEEE